MLPLTLLACLLTALPAQANSTQEVTFEAPRDLYGVDDATRAQAFTQLDSLGVKALRIVLYWKDVAPDTESRVRPSVDLGDPASYDWSKYEPAIDQAAARGWKVQLTVSGQVPTWATNGARDHVTRPRPADFRVFMSAVARKFGPEVTRWSIWNEPNHPDFLKPQYSSSGQPLSPGIYRNLYVNALKGLADAGDAKPVLIGETAPVGTGKAVAPLTFLRGVLCLDSTYKKKGHCPKLRIDGYAHHAYTTKAGPFYIPSGPNNVTIGTLPRLTHALDKAATAGVVARRLPIYLTEFGIQSLPDPVLGVSLAQQNEYRNISERIAYNNTRVVAFSQYLLTDDHPSAPGQYSNFESGLITSEGRVKPAFEGFRLPVAVRKIDGKASLWGLVRPATGPSSVQVQYRSGGRWKLLKTVTTNGYGAWTARSALKSGRKWRTLWVSPTGETFTSPGVRAY
jgi:hypothetical protein